VFSKEEFRNAVIEGLRRITKAGETVIQDDESFEDYGLDSLDAMNLVLEVESILGIDLGESDLGDANTISTFYEKARTLTDEHRP